MCIADVTGVVGKSRGTSRQHPKHWLFWAPHPFGMMNMQLLQLVSFDWGGAGLASAARSNASASLAALAGLLACIASASLADTDTRLMQLHTRSEATPRI